MNIGIQKQRTWRSTGVENLLQQQGGTYYARFGILGKRKLICLRTAVFAVAKVRVLTERLSVEKARGFTIKKSPGTATMADLFPVYRHRFQSLPLAAGTKLDREKALLRWARTWPGFEALRPREIRAGAIWDWASQLPRG